MTGFRAEVYRAIYSTICGWDEQNELCMCEFSQYFLFLVSKFGPEFHAGVCKLWASRRVSARGSQLTFDWPIVVV
jgi:hypothetical protein